MRLLYFSRSTLPILRIQADQPTSYTPDADWLATTLGPPSNYLRESALAVLPPPLLRYDGDKPVRHDAHNAIALHGWLRALPPVVAADPRLWTCMTHHYFRDYMMVRWPIASTWRVKSRYLVMNTQHSGLSHNGIARLWWAAQLTYDPSQDDAYEATRLLFSQQEVMQSVMEVRIGKCAALRRAFLRCIGTHGARLKQRHIQRLTKRLNLFASVALIDALPPSDLERLVDDTAERVLSETPDETRA